MGDRAVFRHGLGRFEEVKDDGGEEGDEKLGKDDEEVVDAENSTSLRGRRRGRGLGGDGRFFQ